MYIGLFDKISAVNIYDKLKAFPPIFHSGLTWRRMESVKAQVDPLPLVPVICRMFSLFRSSGCEIGKESHLADFVSGRTS